MKKYFNFRKYSLKNKLTISYAVPLCLVLIIIALVFFPKYYRSYKKDLELMQNQSYLQTVDYIYQYFTTMNYLLTSMEQDPVVLEEIDKILVENDFEYDSQYRMFWKIKNVIDLRTIRNLKYRIGFYFSENLIFTKNNVNFFSYENFVKTYPYQNLKLNIGNNVYALMEEKKLTPAEKTRELYLTLLKKFNRNDVVIKVEVPVSDIKNILKKAALTKNTQVYLINEKDKISISYSDVAIPQSTELFHYMSYDISGFPWKIEAYTPISEYNWMYESAIFIFILLLLFLISIIFVISYVMSLLITNRLENLSLNMELMATDEYEVPDLSKIDYEQCDEIDKIDYQFNQMALKLKDLMAEQYKQGKKEASSELKALQSQINPHFLYNTLDLINWQALKYHDVEVAKIARNLGMFYRLALNHGKAAVNIKDELKHVQTYINIENQHFDNNIHLEIIVPQIVQAYACLGLILQPIVENSIVHGIASHSDMTDCIITIYAEFDAKEKHILFEIRDNGLGMDQDTLERLSGGLINHDKDGGYGINNIRTRLNLCYEQDFEFYFTSKLGKGTTCHIKIPALTLEQLEARLQ